MSAKLILRLDPPGSSPDAFAPSVEACGDLGGVDGAADRGEVLAVGEAFGGGGRAAPADEAEGAGRDARARRVGLVGGDGLESERGADVLDCGERVGVVEREVCLGGFGAVVHGAENPSCAGERFFRACEGGGRPVAFVLDVCGGEFLDGVDAVRGGQGEPVGT